MGKKKKRRGDPIGDTGDPSSSLGFPSTPLIGGGSKVFNLICGLFRDGGIMECPCMDGLKPSGDNVISPGSLKLSENGRDYSRQFIGVLEGEATAPQGFPVLKFIEGGVRASFYPSSHGPGSSSPLCDARGGGQVELPFQNSGLDIVVSKGSRGNSRSKVSKYDIRRDEILLGVRNWRWKRVLNQALLKNKAVVICLVDGVCIDGGSVIALAAELMEANNKPSRRPKFLCSPSSSDLVPPSGNSEESGDMSIDPALSPHVLDNLVQNVDIHVSDYPSSLEDDWIEIGKNGKPCTKNDKGRVSCAVRDEGRQLPAKVNLVTCGPNNVIPRSAVRPVPSQMMGRILIKLSFPMNSFP